MEGLIDYFFLFAMISVLVSMVLYRKWSYFLKVRFAKSHGVELISGPVDFYGSPGIFILAMGLSRNLVNVGSDTYMFEYYFVEGHLVGKAVDMMIDVSCRTTSEKSFLSERVFSHIFDAYSVKFPGYECTVSDEKLFRFLKAKELSVFYGSWGLIVAPNSGRIRNIEEFKNEFDVVKSIMVSQFK